MNINTSNPYMNTYLTSWHRAIPTTFAIITIMHYTAWFGIAAFLVIPSKADAYISKFNTELKTKDTGSYHILPKEKAYVTFSGSY